MITIFCIRPKGFNVGNDAINFALRELLHQAFGRVVNLISLPATSTYESHGLAGLTSKTVYDINRLADGVIVGGGNLYENGELQISSKAVMALEPPLMLFSLSRGRIFNRKLRLVERTDVMPDETIRLLHEKADFSLTRDSATQQYLKTIGCSGALLAGCPTINLKATAGQLPELPEKEDPGTLISVRTPALMSIPPRLQTQIKEDIKHTINLLRDRGYRRIRLLCHDRRDVEFATLYRDLSNVDYVYTEDVTWYLSLIKNAELVVSYRLHSTIPALSFGTPAINISYDERSRSLIETLGLSEWDISLAEEKNILDAVSRRLTNLSSLKDLLEDVSEHWQGLWNLQLNEMKKFSVRVREYVHGES
ncbi:MAG: polysaccharide pyruvyl transferase family protein [Desulfobacterales bacterium]